MLKVIILILSIPLITTLVTYGQVPQTAQEYLNSSLSHFRDGETDAALKEVDKAIELSPNYVDAFFLRAAIKNKKGDTAGVLADYNKIIEVAPSTPKIEVVYTNRSAIRLQKGEIDGALEDVNKAISVNPKVAIIYVARAVVRLQKGDLDGALADYEKSLELNPNISAALLGRGYFRYQKGDFDGAMADYNKAIGLQPTNANLYISRGIVRGLKNDLVGAVEDIKKGATISPKDVLDESRGNFSSPFKELNQFINKNPSNAQAYVLRGIFRRYQGKEKEAENDFNKGAELEPQLKLEINRIIKEPMQVNELK